MKTINQYLFTGQTEPSIFPIKLTDEQKAEAILAFSEYLNKDAEMYREYQESLNNAEEYIYLIGESENDFDIENWRIIEYIEENKLNIDTILNDFNPFDMSVEISIDINHTMGYVEQAGVTLYSLPLGEMEVQTEINIHETIPNTEDITFYDLLSCLTDEDIKAINYNTDYLYSTDELEYMIKNLKKNQYHCLWQYVNSDVIFVYYVTPENFINYLREKNK